MLISVLFSSFPLDSGLAHALHRVAVELLGQGASTAQVDHQLAHGRVTNLNSEAVLGSIAGPTFEAELTTERGEGKVRFIVTRQGLELLRAREGHPPPAPPRYLN